MLKAKKIDVYDKYYIEIGKIRLIFECGKYVGWYRP
jgi:hypothetical protein